MRHSKPGRKPSKYKLVYWEALPHSTQRPIGDILKSIDELTKEAFMSIDKPQELSTLSEAVAKMPAYMKGLGYYLGDAENEVTIAKDDYEFLKTQKENALITVAPPDSSKMIAPKPLSVAVAERQVAVDSEIISAKDKLRKAQHNYRILKLQYDASNRQFEGWRSRLSVIKQDVREGV